MLPKKERFSSKDLLDIKSAYKNSHKNLKTKKNYTDIGFFSIYEHEINFFIDKTFKKSIIVSKKVSKSAVSRNKLKRIFYNTLLEIKKPELKKENPNLENKSFIFTTKKVFTKEELILEISKV